MVVGVLQVELHVPWAESLKDKRRVVRSVKDRLHREHQASVAEVAWQDTPTRAGLGIAVVATDGGRAGVVLDRIFEKLRALTDAEVAATTREILRGTDSPIGSTGAFGDDELESLGAELLDSFATCEPVEEAG